MKLKVLWLSLLLGLAGCSRNLSIEEIAETVQVDAQKQIDAKAPGNKITSVEIVHKEGNQYTGLIKANDGSQQNVDVTVNGDKVLWQIKR